MNWVKSGTSGCSSIDGVINRSRGGGDGDTGSNSGVGVAGIIFKLSTFLNILFKIWLHSVLPK